MYDVLIEKKTLPLIRIKTVKCVHGVYHDWSYMIILKFSSETL